MHIAFICNEYPPGVHGGIGAVTRTYARALVAAGHRCTVIGLYGHVDTEAHDGEVSDDHGVRVIRLLDVRGLPGLAPLSAQHRLWARLKVEHAQHRIDVVEGSEASFWAAPTRLPYPLMVRMHGGHRFFAEAEQRRTARGRSWAEARSLRRADDLVAVSRYVAERTTALLELGNRPVAVLPNPVDTSVFAPRPEAVESGIVLFLGSVCEKKGIRQLVEAMPTVVAAVPGARLVIAGRDVADPVTGASYVESLRAAVAPSVVDHVDFLGPVGHDEVAELIASAEVCAFPSHMEALPVAWLEALAVGKALVASRTGPGPEVVVDGESGLLVDPYDPDAIARAVTRCLTDPALRARLEGGARSRAVEHFDVADLLNDNITHYAALHAQWVGAAPGPVVEPPIVDHLVVVSHVVHHDDGGQLHAYAPYAKELDRWASMVGRLTVAAPLRVGPAPADSAPLAATNVRMAPQRETGGDRLIDKLAQIVRLPQLVWELDRALRGADAIQVRSPGNLGLLGAVLAPVRSRRVVAKYAGQWHGYPGEPAPWRWQRKVLGSRWFRGPVLAYGPAPGDGAHVVPAFSAALDAAALTRAGVVAAARAPRTSDECLRVLFVGRLSAAKHVDRVIEAVGALADRGRPVALAVVGDGPERASLAATVERAGWADVVTFRGAVDLSAMPDVYASADVLVLASESEGWPKAIVEAMAFGLVCIGNDRGMVPTIVSEGRGFTVPAGDATAIAARLDELAADPALVAATAHRAAAWAEQFSLDRLEQELRDLVGLAWADGSRFGHPPALRDQLAPEAGSGMSGKTGRPTVVQVVDSLDAGGTERVAVQLANELARRGHRSLLVATRRAGPLADEIAPEVEWLCLGRRAVIDPAAARALRHFVHDHDVDVIHAHSTSIFTVALSFPIGRRPAIVWHDHFSGAPDRPARPLRAVRRWIDEAVAVSRPIEAADRRALGLGARLSQLANFSVFDATAEPAADLPGMPGRRVVSVANLRPVKDQLTLIRALARMTEILPDVHLLLVGNDSGPYADRVRTEVRNRDLGANVTLLGVRADIASVLAGCDVAVLSSIDEGTPLALIEYGLAGRAVVATDVGEIGEVLDGGRAGVLVMPGDDSAMAEAVVRLLDDDTERTVLEDRLSRRVADRYSVDRLLTGWAEVYRRALIRNG